MKRLLFSGSPIPPYILLFLSWFLWSTRADESWWSFGYNVFVAIPGAIFLALLGAVVSVHALGNPKYRSPSRVVAFLHAGTLLYYVLWILW